MIGKENNKRGRLPILVFMLLLLVPAFAYAAAPVFQAAGTAQNGTGAVSPAWPAHAVGDVALLFIESTGGEAATLSTPAGFVEVTNSPQATGAGTAGTRLTVFWARATSTAMATPTVADPGNHVAAQILTYRGVITTGDPWDITGGGVKAVASTSLTATGVTTTVSDTLVVVAASQDIDANSSATFSAWANASLTGITERIDFGTNSGNGGGFGVMDGAKAMAGATGNTTATVTSSVNGFLTIALKPPVAGAATQLAFSQQPTDTAAGSTITPAITVEIQDAGGNLVTSATDTVTIAFGTDPSGGTAVLSGTLSVAAVAGIATFSDLSIDTGGTGYTLTAGATGLTGATSNSFNITTPAGTFGATDCAATRFGSDLVCTAQDVSITGISIVPGGPTSCVGGQPIILNLDVNVNFATPNRWDVGLFLSNDGNTPELLPASGGASSCTVAVLDTPTINPATSFLDLDPGPWSGTTDACGDGNSSIGGGSGSGVQRVTGVQVACQAVDLSGGKLFIPFLTSWDNQSSPSGSTCTSNLNPVPNTKSKCNVPDGTVEADVLKSTVSLVVLPTITKTNGITTITAGDITTYTIVITNTTGATLNNAIFKDPAVTYITADSVACSAVTGGATCPLPANVTVSAMQGGGIVIPSMPAGSGVTFTVGATLSSDTPAGTITNTAYAVVSAESNSVADTDNVITKLSVSKSFAPSSIAVGGTSVLTVTIQNTNLTAATGVAFTDNYPANLVNTGTPNAAITGAGCTGTLTAAAGSASLSLTGGTVPVNTTCTYTVNVTSAVAGAYNNTTGAVSSTEGYTGDSASASLAIGASNLSTSTKSWSDLNGGEPDPGDTIRYTITITETAGIAAAGVSVSDTVPADLTGITVVTCPSGATCSVVGQTLSVTNISVSAGGSVSIVFDATIDPLATPGAAINNCATVTNPGGVGASPCAATITVSPSAVTGTGNKRLYLYDGTSTPAHKLSRSIPGAQASVSITKTSSQVWALSPVLQMPVTISPDVTPLAIIPVNLYLASNTASESRTVQVDVTCSGGGTTYTETKIFDGTAVNNPYLSTTPTLVYFANLTISADHTCAAGQTWNLTVRNNTTGNGTRNVIVYPVSGGNNSYISLPSLSIINVDSVNSYDAPYPAVTTPPSGYYAGGDTVYVRAVVSDPFGSFDITAATVTIKDPNDVTVVTDAAMTQVADSGASTKTYEYSYVVPASGPSGFWTTIVTAKEGTENTVSDSGSGSFLVSILPILTVLKSVATYSDPINGLVGPKAIPGSFMTYTIMVTNSGPGAADNNTTAITDAIPANTEMFVGDFDGAGPVSGPVSFIDGASCNAGTAASGLSYSFVGLSNTGDNLLFSKSIGATYDTPSDIPSADGNQCDSAVTHLKLALSGIFNGTSASGGSNTSFCLQFRVRVK